MLQKTLFNILMIPFALVYGIGVSIHNALYAMGILKSLSFNLPVISVGNLSVGGTGKTPHVEYLIKKLSPYIHIAVLSRGYRRKTKGFITLTTHHNADQVGDEPLQYKQKFNNITVAVAERRAFAIPKMMSLQPDLQTIILDDAYQHRAIKPGLNILLTPFDSPFTNDYLMPLGRLREWKSAYTRADYIIVTKCPDFLSSHQRQLMLNEINPLNHQQVFFSKYNYLPPYYLFNKRQKISLTNDLNVIVLCALASSDYLIKYLEKKVAYLEVIAYEDHHYYSDEDLKKLHQKWSTLDGSKNLILTTEKDATRLHLLRTLILNLKLPVFVLPIEVAFLDDDENRFLQNIQSYLLDFKY